AAVAHRAVRHGRGARAALPRRARLDRRVRGQARRGGRAHRPAARPGARLRRRRGRRARRGAPAGPHPAGGADPARHARRRVPPPDRPDVGGLTMASGTVSPTLAVFERHLVLYRRLWQASVFSSFVLPLLFLLSIGVGVGGYVGSIEGVDYLAWIVPGVLASPVFSLALGESTYPVFGDFKWVRA